MKPCCRKAVKAERADCIKALRDRAASWRSEYETSGDVGAYERAADWASKADYLESSRGDKDPTP